jgi:2-oxoglutarate dehydrogenase E1 component
MKQDETLNIDFYEDQYEKWKADPDSVSRDWQYFFKGFEIACSGNLSAPGEPVRGKVANQAGVDALIHRYRDIGHLLACMDPLSACPTEHPLLELDAFGLSSEELVNRFIVPETLFKSDATLKDILKALKETYCRSIGIEYMHLQDPAERRWLQEKMEPVRNRTAFSTEEKQKILEKLVQSSTFEGFLNKKYAGVTRFSLEGGDALIPFLHFLTEAAAAGGVQQIILGMSHRGRLSVQTNILGKTYADIFAEFESCYDPDQLVGSGDVKYHNGYLADIVTESGRPLRMFLVNNPSHLEAVDPVVQGVARALQDLEAGDLQQGFAKILSLGLHGDAAFAGQGVVAETLNMSALEGYRTGGTIHVIINNQIGYTTLPEDARSTRYSTDVAKMLMVPVFHVHGEDPEAVVHVARLAEAYRRTFAKDIVIDLVCYRRFGHNEGDDPYFTQPLMYARIKDRPPLHEVYAGMLTEEKTIGPKDLTKFEEPLTSRLEEAYGEIKDSTCLFPENRFYENWDTFSGRFSFRQPATGVKKSDLVSMAGRLNELPTGFSINRKLKRVLDKRVRAVEQGAGIDWANAESLAVASIIEQGLPVRLSGQDVRRGTFSQRHCVLFDTHTGESYTPLNHLGKNQGRFEVYNSHLAEYGVLGFEYGYAMIRPEGLVMWEAQFGDFINTAQAVIDLFLASGQAKWQRLNGLVLLLPHGMEGMGPEHSSARPERFLQLCADDNMQVCNPTTPAQYFHLLRRQVLAKYRLPLVVLTPKSLLRHPRAVSGIRELSSGAFQPVLVDDAGQDSAGRALFCSGKLYYQLLERRDQLGLSDTIIVRLEQIYPFPEAQLKRVLKGLGKSITPVWAQEEPENMGAWRFVQPLLEEITGKRPEYVGRKASSSPATGFPAIHKREQAAVLDEAVGAIKK